MSQLRCETCRFYHQLQAAHGEPYRDPNGDTVIPLALGECRARPPRNDYYLDNWPHVTHRDWCGGWQNSDGETM